MTEKKFLRDLYLFFKKNNFIYLFVSLTFLLFASTLILEIPGEIGSDLFTVITILMIVVSMQSVRYKVSWKRVVYGLSILFAVLAVLSNFRESIVYILLLLTVLLIFFAGTFLAMAKNVLFKGEIDGNKIIGSMSLYMLLGLVWTIIYLILLTLDPKAISGIEAGQWQETFASVAYFSFVTLTTLGYGDILPVNQVARFFVYMETIIGVFYMAIIVSSLVAMRLDTKGKKKKEAMTETKDPQ